MISYDTQEDKREHPPVHHGKEAEARGGSEWRNRGLIGWLRHLEESVRGWLEIMMIQVKNEQAVCI